MLYKIILIRLGRLRTYWFGR